MEAMGKPAAPVLDRPGVEEGPTDHQLVGAVRRGDDRAFEVLYTRYRRRIAAYCYGKVGDYGRAEDLTQEVFVSALRRIRQTERPIAFKPWIYEIAKNACIDAYRRGRRAEEVSIDADDRLSAADHGRLAETAPGPDEAVDTKQDLDLLCGAFGGLTDTHHEILVMREFEGLSYKDIGERMGMSRPAVESTLFRARKRLGEEYDELASGARCLRIQGIITEAGQVSMGVRDQRRLARHVAHCQPCRRLAVECGVEIPLTVPRRVARKLAGLLPLPGVRQWLAHLPAVSDSMGSGWSKAAAGLAALLVAGAGAGVTTTIRGGHDEPGAGARPAAERTVEQAAPGPAARTPAAPAAARTDAAARRRTTGSVRRAGGRRDRSGGASLGGGGRDDATTAPRTTGPATGGSAPAAGDQPSGGSSTGGTGGRTQSQRDGAKPPPTAPVTGPVQETADNVDQTVQNATQNLQQTVDNAAQNVTNVVNDPANLVPNLTQTTNDAVNDTSQTVGGAVEDLSNTVGGLLGP